MDLPPPPLPRPPDEVEKARAVKEAKLWRGQRVVGGLSEVWNYGRCWDGKGCAPLDCRDFHSTSERRCKVFASTGRCDEHSAEHGLHVRSIDCCEVHAVDLASYADVQDLFEKYECLDVNMRARVVQLVVLNFCGDKANVLEKLVQYLPLLCEVYVPDRQKHPNLCVFFADIIERVPESNPRFREVRFQGNELVQIC